MVDSIGSRPATGAGAVAAVAPTQRATRPASRQDELVAEQSALSALAFDFDKTSPVDTAHVEAVRRAIRNGTYPILPETIADRLLALKLDWSPRR